MATKKSLRARYFVRSKALVNTVFPSRIRPVSHCLCTSRRWLKCHTPAAFTAALLNSQPMGFYSASQLTQDARRHDVEIRKVDINQSDWDCTLESSATGAAALRLGLRQVKGFSEAAGRRVVEARPARGYTSIQALLEAARAGPARTGRVGGSRCTEAAGRAPASGTLGCCRC